jgi:hypothetical protein
MEDARLRADRSIFHSQARGLEGCKDAETARRLSCLLCGVKVSAIRVLLRYEIAALPPCKSESGLFVTGDKNPTFEIRRSYFDEVKVFPILTVVKLDPDNERLPPPREDDSKNTVLWKILPTQQSQIRLRLKTWIESNTEAT